MFTEPARNGRTPPWAGDFRPTAGSDSIKKAVGKTLQLELPDGRTGRVLVQAVKGGKRGFTLSLLGEDTPPF